MIGGWSTTRREVRCASGAAQYARNVTVLFLSHDLFSQHETPTSHPERPARLQAVQRAIERFDLTEALTRITPRRAGQDEMERVHRRGLVEGLARLAEGGGGPIDADTSASADSYDAAAHAAGAGLDAIERITAGEARRAFCAVRPPGHHATPSRSMGFCLLNNVGITAASLAERGERVAIVDIDAHHGNGTQDAFYEDDRVLFCSLHQWPLYPGTGAADEIGEGPGRGSNLNIPLPAGATGDTYRFAIEAIVAPAVEAFGATWLLVSAGFDGHRDDPLTGLGLTSGDIASISQDLLLLAGERPSIWFLEGGYDLDALTASAGACLGALVGERVVPESETAEGPGRDVVTAVRAVHHAAIDDA